MADPLKITDVSTLKGISKLLAPPLLCTAYILQSGMQVNAGAIGSITLIENENVHFHFFKFFLIFVLKSLFVLFCAYVSNLFLIEVHKRFVFPWIYVTSVILIAFSLLGLFGREQYNELNFFTPFWFYSFIVWGIYLQTLTEPENNI